MAGTKRKNSVGLGIVPEFDWIACLMVFPQGIPWSLPIDELEVIRLLDLEKMRQEEAAACIWAFREPR